jgi:hypothetical protein
MKFKDYVYKKFKKEDIKLSGNTETLRITCINKKCEDRTKGTKHKLNIDLKTGVFHCFRCGIAGAGLRKFIEIIEGKTHAPITVEQFDRDLSDFRKKIAAALEIKAPKIRKLDYPESYVSAFESIYAMNYIRRRKIPDEVTRKFKLGWCISGKYAFRVMFPSFDKHGNLIYYGGRAILGTNTKMLNIEIDKEDLLYGSEFLDSKKDFVVVTEGPFSCITVNENAVALYSKHIAPKQMIKLRNLPVKKYYIMLDGDARAEAIKLAENLLKFDKKVFLVNMEKKDPNDLGHAECWKKIENADEITEKYILLEKIS